MACNSSTWIKKEKKKLEKKPEVLHGKRNPI
jgi:hypothetical protein